MTAHKATPGPWTYIDATKVAAMQFAPKCVIMAGEREIASFSWHDNSPWFPTKAESQANARLIAAGPTMFEALADMVSAAEALEPGTFDPHSLQAARAALSRAEGSQP